MPPEKALPILRLVREDGPGETIAPRVCDELAGLSVLAAQGNRRAVRTLLTTLLPHLLRVARQVRGAHHPDVGDVAQESASHLLDALPRFRGESTMLHFACRIAVLTAMNARRRRSAMKRAAEADPDVELEDVASSATLPDEILAARRSMQAIRSLLDTLPLEQAETLALRCVLGYTLAEIAAAAGVPLETARSRLRLAKLQVRRRALSDPRLAELAEDPS
jgi:RNA polymerase sigma factor (sigma-70 family)